jgi:hypothetical protein
MEPWASLKHTLIALNIAFGLQNGVFFGAFGQSDVSAKGQPPLKLGADLDFFSK